jgi:hypothetical protein
MNDAPDNPRTEVLEYADAGDKPEQFAGAIHDAEWPG